MKKVTIAIALAAGLSVSAMAADWTGYIVDKACSGNKAMWTNSACSQKCVKGGDEAVFVTEDGKIFKVDQTKVAASVGKKVTVSGTMKGDAIDVTAVKGL
jgi:hypothetical protein